MGNVYRRMLTCVLLLLWKMIVTVKSQFYICPDEEGRFFATSPDCVIYYQCENYMLQTGVCFPWYRFDVHTLTCKQFQEVDCNPEYAGIWRAAYGERPETGEDSTEEIAVTGKGQNETITVTEEVKEAADKEVVAEEHENKEENEHDIEASTKGKNNTMLEEESKAENNKNVTEENRGESDGLRKTKRATQHDNAQVSDGENEDKNDPDKPLNVTSMELDQEGSSGSYLYWCGSGRVVIVESNEEGESACLQLQDPEFIDQEGSAEEEGAGDGHTFLGSDTNPWN